MDQQLFEAVDHYIGTLLAPQDEVLQAIQQSHADTNMPHASITPSQGKLLQVLALLCNAHKILEIGTLAGYSTIWMARALPENGRLITLEYDQTHVDVARQNIARADLASKVDIREGRALQLLPALEAEGAGPFDMIFIDADKPPYVEYFQWAVRLAHPGALIVADNVIRGGDVLTSESGDPSVVGAQRFNEMLAAHDGVTAVILPMVGRKGYDGMALAVVNRP